MHYYSFHIRDYRSKTCHLTRNQNFIYRLLLDECYLNEKPLSADPAECARRIGMSDCLEDVKAVLGDFFELHEDGYHNKRCDRELARLAHQQEMARQAGIASGEARRARAQAREQGLRAGTERQGAIENRSVDGRFSGAEQRLNVCSTDVEAPNTHNPIPITHRKPLTPLAPSAFAHSPPKAAEAVDNVVLAVDNQAPPESAGGTSPPDAGQTGKDPVIAMPLHNGKTFGVAQAQVDEWQRSYPGVDVLQQLRHMREWCLSNPTKRKTPRGVRTFITGWLGREQDRAGARQAPGLPGPPTAARRYDGREEALARLEGSRFCTVNQLNFRKGVEADGRIV